MASLEQIKLGSDDPTAIDSDTLRQAFAKCNNNFMTLMVAHLELQAETEALRRRVERLERS